MSVKKTQTKKEKRTIDWNDVHARMQNAEGALKRGFQPSREQKNKILKERAKTLAQEEIKETQREEIEVVEFLLAHERYAFETAYVREVYPLKELTPLPGTPPFILGITNVRGQIVSVVDMKKFFELPEKGLTDLNKIILLHSDKMEFGVLADVITGVRKLFVDELQLALPTLTGIREEYLKGVTKERVVVLDAGEILSDEKIVVNETV